MSKLTITFLEAPDAQLLNRINGVVAVAGSYVKPFGPLGAILVHQENVRTGSDCQARDTLTPQEVATFVRNFLDEGFTATITII